MLIVLMIWEAGVESVAECDMCEMVFLYLKSGRAQVSRTSEGMDDFDVNPVGHGSWFLDLRYGDGPIDLYNKEHTSPELSQGSVLSIGSVTAAQYHRKSQKGRPCNAKLRPSPLDVINTVYI